MSDELVIVWPTYQVELKRNVDGATFLHTSSSPWYDHSESWWTEGNGACDCNRHLCFQGFWEDGVDLPPNDDPRWERPCGDTAYTAIRAIFPDGSTLKLDD